MKLNHDILVNKLEKPEAIWAKYFQEIEQDPDWRNLFYGSMQLYVNFIKTHRHILLKDCLETRPNITEPCNGERDSDYDIVVITDEDIKSCSTDIVRRSHVHTFVVAFDKRSGRITSISPASE